MVLEDRGEVHAWSCPCLGPWKAGGGIREGGERVGVRLPALRAAGMEQGPSLSNSPSPLVSSAPGEVCQPLGPQPLVWAPPRRPPTLCGVPLINISPFELRVCLFPPGAAVYTVSTHNLASPSEPQDLIPVSSVEP